MEVSNRLKIIGCLNGNFSALEAEYNHFVNDKTIDVTRVNEYVSADKMNIIITIHYLAKE